MNFQSSSNNTYNLSTCHVVPHLVDVCFCIHQCYVYVLHLTPFEAKKKETYRWCNYTWLFVKFTCALQRITAHHHKIDGDWSDSNWESQMSVECWYVIKNVNSPSHCNLSLKNSKQKRKRNIKIVSFINVNIKAQTSIHIHLNAPSCKVQIIEMITIMFIRQICHWINSINIH